MFSNAKPTRQGSMAPVRKMWKRLADGREHYVPAASQQG